MSITLNYQQLTPTDFAAVIHLATQVHGEGYLDQVSMQAWYEKGLKNGINAGFVVYHEQHLVGFRITYAVQQWKIDQWCSTELWPVAAEHVCYFKCNTVDENYRGHGIGGELLKRSIAAAKQQGARAGVSHLWKQSPGNSAVKYFTKCGGILIKNHPDRWHELSLAGYECPICHNNCRCEAAEMMVVFN
jgi:N-acetylglutamate synthase-like GNAT family acetyltransferase